MTYVYLMRNNKELSLEIIKRHVEHLRELDAIGVLVLCGPFSDYPVSAASIATTLTTKSAPPPTP